MLDRLPEGTVMLHRLNVDSLSMCFEVSPHGIVVLDEEARYIYANPSASQIIGYSIEDLLKRDLFMNTPAHAHEALRKHIKEVGETASAGAPRPHLGSGWVLRPDGEERAVEWIVAPIVMDGRKRAVVMFHDVTETRRLARNADALSHIASTVAFAGSLEQTLDALAAQVVEATGTINVGLFLLDEKEQVHVAGTACLVQPDGPDAVLGPPVPVSEKDRAAWEEVVLAGAPAPGFEAVLRNEPVVLQNFSETLLADSRYGRVHDQVRRWPVETLASFPMRYGKRTVGWMNVAYSPGRRPSDGEISFLSTIAHQAAVAAENARLLVEARAKAALEERQRLARELHDSVSQALYGIALGARTARTLLDRDPAQAAEPLDYVLSLAEAGLAEMRALIFELRPESLKEEGLIAALTKQIDSVRARHKIAVRADLSDEPQISLESKEAVYRIAQEALTNAVRHARASQVELRLQNGDERLELEVADNGVGFDDAESFPGHLGLRSMRERAAAVGGALEVETTPGSGTSIRVRIPVQSGA